MNPEQSPTKTIESSPVLFAGNLFEQYQLFVEETARISDRRHSTSNLFLSVNSVLVGAIALLLQQSGGKGGLFLLFLAFLLVAAGTVLCILWMQLLLKYAKRLRKRFTFLSNLEKANPSLLLSVFSNKDLGSESFSHLEARIPVVFLGAYILAVVGTLAILFDWLSFLARLLPQ
jgi:hypothetical protein